MAKTRPSTAEQRPAEWSAAALVDAVQSGTREQKSARLRRIGILTAEGTLAPKYKNWGSKVSRTPES
jgi:hypothetical protein